MGEFQFESLDVERIVTGMPGGFFIYHADGDEEIIYANSEVLYLYGCQTMEEFRALTGNSFRGMIHPDDLEEAEASIAHQIAESQRYMDYVEYRIVRKDGEIRWVEDFGHLLKSELYGNIFYVFVSDVTDKHKNHVEKEQKYLDIITDQEAVSRALQLTLHVYREIYMVDLDQDSLRRVYPDGEENGSYRDIINTRILQGIISSEKAEDIEKLLQPETIKEALMNEDSVEYRYSRKGDDDTMERCSTLIAVTNRVEGVPTSVVVGVRSIENIVQREERQNMLLEGALLHAEHANEAKNTFLANMSHDIRTPLNVIMGFTDLAMSHLDDEAKTENCLKKIKASSQQLLELIDDILDMSKIEAGTMDIAKAECNIERIMSHVWHNLEKQIFEKNMHYEVDMSRVKNPDILCDEMRLNQILLNVISNAVKYTPADGSVYVKISQEASLGPGVSYYEFRVKDNGAGISPDFVARIFEPFEREKTSTVSKVNGTGLGLAITKSLVDLMNGTIDVRSKVGEGSEFIIKIPFQKIKKNEPKEQDEAAGLPAKGQDGYFQGKRILLVEDNELNREIAKTLLEEKGMIVGEAEDGDLVIPMLQAAEIPYDCIVMDIQMPHMNGYKASKAIRELSDPVLSQIPIIGMSANAFEEDKKKALEMGMNEHIAKPIDINVVLSTLEKYI